MLSAKDTLISEAKKLIEDNSDKSFTRKLYRSLTGNPDSVWEKEFGTWNGFVSALGYSKSKIQKKFDLALAEHVSNEMYDDEMQKKQTWGDRYLLDDKTERFKTILTGSDIHDRLCDPFYRRLFVDTAKRSQPSKIILPGDVFEMLEFSSYDKDPRKCDIVASITWVHEFLRDLREASPNSEITILAGNHECVSMDTDVLTEYGFMDVTEYLSTEGVKIASFDGEKINYHLPIDKKLTDLKKTVTVNTAMTCERVSTDHNLYVNKTLVKSSAVDKAKTTYKNFTTSVNMNKDLPDLINDDFVALMVQIVTDATLVYEGGNLKRIQWKLSKTRKIDRVKDLLTRNNIPFTFREATKGGINVLQPYYICVYTKAARELFEWCLLTAKEFPREITRLNNRQFALLANELAVTDGSYHFNHMSWTTTNKNDCDLVAEAAFLNDVASKTSCVENVSGFSRTSGNSSKVQYHQTLYIGQYDGKKNFDIVEHTEPEHTVAIQTVDGTLITRYNGRIQVTGNCRLHKMLIGETPHLIPILSDIAGMAFDKLLGLDKFNVNYISKESLKVHRETDIKNEIAKNYMIAYDSVLFHHFPYSKEWGFPAIWGHHHKLLITHKFNASRGPYSCMQLGSGHIRQAEYCEGEQWQNAFSLVHIDTHKKYVQFEPIDCTGDMCVIGGQYYFRKPEEILKIFSNVI